MVVDMADILILAVVVVLQVIAETVVMLKHLVDYLVMAVEAALAVEPDMKVKVVAV
jgi:hypothetical protein